MQSIRQERAVAFHEAGHAVVAALVGILRNDASITIASAVKGEHGAVSISTRPWNEWSAHYTRKAILAVYGGPAVTKKLIPGVDLLEEGGYYELDMVFAENLMRRCAPGQWEWTGDAVFQSYKDKMWKRATTVVNSNWSAITAVAKQLLKHKTMTGLQVKTTMQAR